MATWFLFLLIHCIILRISAERTSARRGSKGTRQKQRQSSETTIETDQQSLTINNQESLNINNPDQNLVSIYSETMDNINLWIKSPNMNPDHARVTSGTGIQEPFNFCTHGDCIVIEGHSGEDNYIIHREMIPQMGTFLDYKSFAIKVDVHLYDMESNNFCEVSFKWNDQDSFQLLHRFIKRNSEFEEHFTNEIINFRSRDDIATLNYIEIKLETNGNSGSGSDFCFWDNFNILGRIEGDIIWEDAMDDLNQWNRFGNVDVGVFSRCQSSARCVEMNGHLLSTDAIQRITTGIGNKHSFSIHFDAYLYDMEDENGLQIFYKYDNEDEYNLIRTISGADPVQGVNWIHQIVLIPPPPNVNYNDLFIRFENNGDSTSPSDYVYLDNIMLKGMNGKYDEKDTLEDASNQQPATEHNLILFGDMGGTDDDQFDIYTTPEQLNVAEMLKTVIYTNQYKIEGIVECGDNFYSDGVDNKDSDRFDTTWKDVYKVSDKIKDIPWYITLGNHDYEGNGEAQVEYAASQAGKDNGWFMGEDGQENSYYSHIWNYENDVSLQLIVLDTFILCGFTPNSGDEGTCKPENKGDAEDHWEWIDDTLAAIPDDNSRFVIMASHNPIYSHSFHGPSRPLDELLKPKIEDKVNIYVAGHDHILFYGEDEEVKRNLHYIISGAGSSCRLSQQDINSETNPNEQTDFMRFYGCKQGGFIRLKIDTVSKTMQAFFYFGISPFIQFFTGIWHIDGTYDSIDELLARTPPVITPEPTTSEPTTSEPTTSEPTTSEPTTSEPTTSEPTAGPTTLTPTAGPTTSKPTAGPTTSEPTSLPTDPLIDEPSAFVCCDCLVATDGGRTPECAEDRDCNSNICVVVKDNPEFENLYDPDPFCCNDAWDRLCVVEATILCNAEIPKTRSQDVLPLQNIADEITIKKNLNAHRKFVAEKKEPRSFNYNLDNQHRNNNNNKDKNANYIYSINLSPIITFVLISLIIILIILIIIRNYCKTEPIPKNYL